jgi:hypothetical protein
MRTTLIGATLFAAAATVHAYQITFETTECNGDTGFAAVEVDRVYRVEADDCGPQQPGEKRKQVLVRASAGPTRYDVFTVAEKEGQRIQNEIRKYNDARRRSLDRGGTIMIDRP